MNDLLTQLILLIKNILILPIVWIFPIKWTVVMPGSTAVRFTFGHPGPELQAGTHFATTGQTMHQQHTNIRLAVADSMYVLTEDGVSLRIRGVAIYKITSLIKYLTATEDSDEFMIEACEASIKHAVSHVPFEDLVVDSDTVESVISDKMAEICDELGVYIKRYRFQDVELTDPIGRGLSSIKSMAPGLTEAAQKMSKSLSIPPRDALIVLSPNVQFVADIMSTKKTENDFETGEANES